MAEGHGPTAVSRRLFFKYQIVALSRRTINVWYQSYMQRESHADRGENSRPKTSITKQKQIEEMFKSEPRGSFRDVGEIVNVPPHRTVWNIFTYKLETFSISPTSRPAPV